MLRHLLIKRKTASSLLQKGLSLGNLGLIRLIFLNETAESNLDKNHRQKTLTGYSSLKVAVLVVKRAQQNGTKKKKRMMIRGKAFSNFEDL